MRRRGYLIFISLIAIIFLTGIFACSKRESSKEKLERLASSAGRKAKVRDLKGELDVQNAITSVATKAGPAVVAVTTERTQKLGMQGPQFKMRRFGPRSPFQQEDPMQRFFEEFFGRMPQREFKQKGMGSGFIIDKNGFVLTNYHVVQGADKINIMLPDGRQFEGRLKGADPRTDLAVIKIDARDLPAVELGNSDLVQTGEWVVALGNPFGHVIQNPEPTVTVGVISALHRKIPTPKGEHGYLDLIQTDAAINPGNSGGPLCDLGGKVIAINVAIFSTSGGYQGIGFAIPVNVAKEVLNDLKRGKEIEYGWLGVGVQEITPAMAKYFRLPDTEGALISQIVIGSPAEKAGLRAGDVVRTFNGNKIKTVHDLLQMVGKAKVGKAVKFGIIREGAAKAVDVRIGKRPLGPEDVKPQIQPSVEVPKWCGMVVSAITDPIAQELQLEDREGVVVIEVDSRSLCFEAGLRPGDVIREMNRTLIKNLPDYKKMVQEVKGPVLVRTDRGYFLVNQK